MGPSGHWRQRTWMLLALAPALLHAQDIYRCGNSYGQTPCAHGVVIRADDSRTAAQKAQTDAATAQAARQAERMEGDRLAAERRAIAAAQQQLRIPQKSPSTAARTAGRRAGAPQAAAAARPKTRTGANDPFTATARTDDAHAIPAPARPRD